MATPIESVKHLGPYSVDDVTDAMLDSLVRTQGIPIVLRQSVQVMGGVKTDYAVLATRDLRIVCSGCFRRGMCLTDKKRCKTCASFVKHTNMKGHVRLVPCKDDGLLKNIEEGSTKAEVADVVTTDHLDDAALLNMVKDRGLVDDLVNDSTITTEAILVDAVKKRELIEKVMNGMEEKALDKAFHNNGKPNVLTATPDQLVHELARRYGTMDADTYYADKKKVDSVGELPHKTDRVQAKLVVTTTDGTQTTLRFKDMALGDKDWRDLDWMDDNGDKDQPSEDKGPKTPKAPPIRSQRQNKGVPPNKFTPTDTPEEGASKKRASPDSPSENTRGSKKRASPGKKRASPGKTQTSGK